MSNTLKTNEYRFQISLKSAMSNGGYFKNRYANREF